MNVRSFLGEKSGLYLKTESLVIKSTATKINIEWADIKSFHCVDRKLFSLIAIDLFNNQKFLKGKNLYYRTIGNSATKKFGTPILIVANYYDVSKIELLAELNYRLEKHQNFQITASQK